MSEAAAAEHERAIERARRLLVPTDAFGNTHPPEPEEGAPRALQPVPRAELKRIRKQVARRRKEGESEVWTDEELEKEGYSRGGEA